MAANTGGPSGSKEVATKARETAHIFLFRVLARSYDAACDRQYSDELPAARSAYLTLYAGDDAGRVTECQHICITGYANPRRGLKKKPPGKVSSKWGSLHEAVCQQL